MGRPRFSPPPSDKRVGRRRVLLNLYLGRAVSLREKFGANGKLSAKMTSPSWFIIFITAPKRSHFPPKVGRFNFEPTHIAFNNSTSLKGQSGDDGGYSSALI